MHVSRRLALVLPAGALAAAVAVAWWAAAEKEVAEGWPGGSMGAPGQPRPTSEREAVAEGLRERAWTRQEAVALGRTRDPSAAPRLRELALTSTNPLVAGNALRALGRIGAARNDPALLALLRDSRPRIRQEAVVAFGSSGDRSLVEELAPLLDERDPALRPLVIQALGRLGGERAKALLESAARDPRSTETDRAFARGALAPPAQAKSFVRVSLGRRREIGPAPPF